MWYLIVTARSLIWVLLSIFSTLLMLNALLSPTWIIASPQTATFGNNTITYKPSLGVYAKCGRPINLTYPICTSLLSARGFSTESHIFPDVWKASIVFLSLGISIMSLTVGMGLLSCSFQSIFKKSIFTISGSAQAAAGICFIIGVMLHPIAWGSDKVQKVCGRDASPFYMDCCSLGIGLWSAIIGTILTFVCACLSLPAEKSTSSNKVQDKIYEGQTLICLT